MSEWAAIEGFLGRYAVSDEGEVLSMDFAQSGLPGLLKPLLRDGRYLSVCLYDGEGRSSWHFVHVLVAGAFLGPKPEGSQVNHIDGVRANNRSTNLEYVTRSGNMKHAFALGLQCNKGERHSQHRLMEADVLKIRELVALGLSQTEVADRYGIGQPTVSKIASRKAWPHVDATGEIPAARVH